MKTPNASYQLNSNLCEFIIYLKIYTIYMLMTTYNNYLHSLISHQLSYCTSTYKHFYNMIYCYTMTI